MISNTGETGCRALDFDVNCFMISRNQFIVQNYSSKLNITIPAVSNTIIFVYLTVSSVFKKSAKSVFKSVQKQFLAWLKTPSRFGCSQFALLLNHYYVDFLLNNYYAASLRAFDIQVVRVGLSRSFSVNS